MTTHTLPLAEIIDTDLASMSISPAGKWMIFKTRDGNEFRLCCNSLVLVSSDDYWTNYAARDEIKEMKTFTLSPVAAG